MSEAVEFFIPIIPVAKQRPRVAKGQAFTPERTKRYEENLNLVAAVKMRKARMQAWTKPCEVHLHFSLPKGARGDLDNYVKSALDGLNGVAFADDRLVVGINARMYRGRDTTGVGVRVCDPGPLADFGPPPGLG